MPTFPNDLPTAAASHADAEERARFLAGTPLIIPAAVCVAIGITAAELFPLPVFCLPCMSAVWLIAALILSYFRSRLAAKIAVLIAVGCLSGSRWNFFQQQAMIDFGFVSSEPQTLTLRAIVANAPVVNRRIHESHEGRAFGAERQTRFEVRSVSLLFGQQILPFAERLQVLVEHDTEDRLSTGDQVRLTGHFNVPRPPSNPGQFNFARRLRRQGLAGRLFVNHPDAIVVESKASLVNPLRWSSWLRSECSRILRRHVAAEVQGMAIALLLGDRIEIPSATEQSFVASGSMHLLAISGLHVGVLFLLVLRLLNWLFLKRSHALLLTLGICLLYALMTGGRPSVVRATLFIALFVVAEVTGRSPKLPTLIATTAILMMLVRPWIVFDTGAWLSFLSVSALCWLARPARPDDSLLPPDDLTWRDRLRSIREEFFKVLSFRHRQMLAILLLTSPLVAVSFHVVAPIGLLLNVVLLSLIVPVLWLGFATLFVGLLSPQLVAVPAGAFSWGLQVVNSIVETFARWQIGHVYVSDISFWFVPLYYGLLITWFFVKQPPIRRVLLCGLLTTVCVGFAAPAPPRSAELQCTVLDVGHGNAVVIEQADRVLLVDAGAMNRGEAAANIISEYLWWAGHRTISGILVSHADADHFNALPHLLRRFRVGEVYLPRTVEAESAAAVQQIIHSMPARTKLRVLRSGDQIVDRGAFIRVLQADQLPEAASDNERSLVVEVTFAGRRILLPGDLEGAGRQQLLGQLRPVDVLLSPHHGATGSNSPDFAAAVQPQVVVVSSNNLDSIRHLHQVYAESSRVLFTQESGATTVRIHPDGHLRVREFLPADPLR